MKKIIIFAVFFIGFFALGQKAQADQHTNLKVELYGDYNQTDKHSKVSIEGVDFGKATGSSCALEQGLNVPMTPSSYCRNGYLDVAFEDSSAVSGTCASPTSHQACVYADDYKSVKSPVSVSQGGKTQSYLNLQFAVDPAKGIVYYLWTTLKQYDRDGDDEYYIYGATMDINDIGKKDISSSWKEYRLGEAVNPTGLQLGTGGHYAWTEYFSSAHLTYLTFGKLPPNGLSARRTLVGGWGTTWEMGSIGPSGNYMTAGTRPSSFCRGGWIRLEYFLTYGNSCDPEDDYCSSSGTSSCTVQFLSPDQGMWEERQPSGKIDLKVRFGNANYILPRPPGSSGYERPLGIAAYPNIWDYTIYSVWLVNKYIWTGVATGATGVTSFTRRGAIDPAAASSYSPIDTYGNPKKVHFGTMAEMDLNGENYTTLSFDPHPAIRTQIAGSYRYYLSLSGNYLAPWDRQIITGRANLDPWKCCTAACDNASGGCANAVRFNCGDWTCGNISEENTDFGIIKTPVSSWIQSVGSDIRWDSASPSYLGIPPSGQFASLTGTGGMPGILFTGKTNPFNGQAVSSTNWQVGSFSNPDLFTDTHSLIPTSYRFLLETVEGSGITKKTATELCDGGQANCTLKSNLTNGVYHITGNLTLNAASDYTFPAGKNFVILVGGNITIKNRIFVPTTSTAIFSASGNITVDRNIGEGAAVKCENFTSHAGCSIEGLYSADKSFTADGANSCPAVDKRLNIAGSVIANAARHGGTFINNRTLCSGNAVNPAVTFIERPDFMINYPSMIKQTSRTWRDEAP